MRVPELRPVATCSSEGLGADKRCSVGPRAGRTMHDGYPSGRISRMSFESRSLIIRTHRADTASHYYRPSPFGMPDLFRESTRVRDIARSMKGEVRSRNPVAPTLQRARETLVLLMDDGYLSAREVRSRRFKGFSRTVSRPVIDNEELDTPVFGPEDAVEGGSNTIDSVVPDGHDGDVQDKILLGSTTAMGVASAVSSLLRG